MKKIIAIILALAALFSLSACNNDEEGPTIADVTAMYASSAPTKIVTTTTQIIGDTVTLNGVEEMKTGKIDGKIATVYTYSIEELAEISSGAEIKGAIETVTGSKEFFDGKVRVNGGSWMPDYNFAPAEGDIAINLDEANLKDVVFGENMGSFTVEAKNTAAVFGEENELEADVEVVITNDGAYITGITLTYTIAESDDYPEVVVTKTTLYTYDLEEITLVK